MEELTKFLKEKGIEYEYTLNKCYKCFHESKMEVIRQEMCVQICKTDFYFELKIYKNEKSASFNTYLKYIEKDIFQENFLCNFQSICIEKLKNLIEKLNNNDFVLSNYVDKKIKARENLENNIFKML